MSLGRGQLARALSVPIPDLAAGELAPVTVAILDSGIDVLVLDDIVLRRSEQSATIAAPRRQYELD